MFIKIQDEDILNVDEVKRVTKSDGTIWDETIEKVYKIIIYTNSFDVVEYIYGTPEDRNKDFNTIWDHMNISIKNSNDEIHI